MSKKEKLVFALAKDFQAMIAMVPKLEAFIDVHKEIAAGYQKYRKNGGAAIPGIEKHLAIKEEKSSTSIKKKEAAVTTETKTPKKAKEPKEVLVNNPEKKAKKKSK